MVKRLHWRRRSAACFLVALSSVAGLSLPAAAAASGSASAAPRGTIHEVAGTSVTQVSDADLPAELARLHTDGVNAVSEFVWWLADGPHADSVHPFAGTVSDSRLQARIAMEEQAGMRVILSPVFYCTGCEGGWRGTIKPRSLSAFFASYRAFVDHYANIAQATHAWILFVGSEMTSLESQLSAWLGVVSSVRDRFGGLLAYEENWDVLGQAGFAPTVDVIGVSAYFPLDDSAVPGLGDLLSDWHHSAASATAGKDWVAALQRLAAKTGRPIMFGEAGYMSSDFAGRQPFLEFMGRHNFRLQGDLYQALLETFEGKSWWLGTVWWEWYGSSQRFSDDRTPRGKSAEEVMRRWYAEGIRPPSPDQEVVPAVTSATIQASAHLPPDPPLPPSFVFRVLASAAVVIVVGMAMAVMFVWMRRLDWLRGPSAASLDPAPVPPGVGGGG